MARVGHFLVLEGGEILSNKVTVTCTSNHTQQGLSFERGKCEPRIFHCR